MVYEYEGKTERDAIEAAAADLGLEQDQFDVEIIETQKNGLFKNVPQSPYVYFVHSYHAVPEDKDIVSSTCFYGEEITASISAENIMATQFHPEKSGDIGLNIIQNFIYNRSEGST